MGVMTMKIISSTNITSTIGVTLMLELTFFPSSLFAIAIGLRLLLAELHAACDSSVGSRLRSWAPDGTGAPRQQLTTRDLP
jgi:hypothetical protein